MNILRGHFVIALLGVACVAAACGGNVVLDGTGGGGTGVGGVGGNGGGSVTTGAGAGSLCTAAGGTCVIGGIECSGLAPTSAQDCDNDENPGGAVCCLTSGTGAGG